jgi:Flp pilus assembly protein TadB
LSFAFAGAKIALHVMNEPDHENQHAPLSYHGAWRIVWLVFLLVIIWLILRALQPVILLFALAFLLAMVLNPIVVWLQKHHIPRFAEPGLGPAIHLVG